MRGTTRVLHVIGGLLIVAAFVGGGIKLFLELWNVSQSLIGAIRPFPVLTVDDECHSDNSTTICGIVLLTGRFLFVAAFSSRLRGNRRPDGSHVRVRPVASHGVRYIA